MYRKKSRGWYKHKDFILIDLICLFLSLLIAHLIRNGSVQSLFRAGIYRNMISFVILADLFLIIIFESYKGVLRRGHYQELHSVIRQMILLELASGLYLFTVSDGHSFSRTVLYLMGVFYVFLSYGTRIAWKKHLIHKMAEGGEHSLYIVTNYDQAAKVIRNVKEHNYNRYNINGLIIVDKNAVGRKISGIPVVAELENAASYICQQWVDEVFVNIDESYSYPDELIQELLEMGMVVHVNLAKVKSTSGQKQFVETVGGYTVLTTTMNYATDRQAFAKRALDILGGLVGCFLTGIIFIFVAPAIYISSPGPIFFSQTRIGQNGKPFKMYKFRSMYMDAEERKAELMAQNKMSDGRMFKLDFDPRVIGNKILPDGSRKTGIGEFIRKTSLDEFPQFWNVLNGTMSLVGTRPILQDELLKYELHHRARIAIKPGITGMWQVSGRSDITDFEEVVRLDTEYISKMYFTNITGGEPFIRTDLKDIVRELYKKSDRIVISTNGFFTDRIVDLCKEFPQIGIRISIEGLEQTNNEIRGLQNGYQRGYGTLKKLREMGMKDVGFGMTVQDKNAPDLVPLYKISDEMGMEFATASLHNSFYFVEAKNIIHDRPMVAKNFENLVNELLRSNSPKKWFRAYFNHGLINYIYGQKRLLPCDMSFDTFFIDPYGDVMCRCSLSAVDISTKSIAGSMILKAI